ncbi:uncharacterized protein KY384_007571 [Bacidia gigantensis]|uniref:uncharacterized protein n=1 Tax=Bacidia gigantensis TaxID=2732470 RepID=UPI001D04921E|nr:uncharacterized protein KY384_007571 [Bacidia gigantensis]KAG8527419.1 hypothetical protein KY384_007571 [Bacidia gigantensis]
MSTPSTTKQWTVNGKDGFSSFQFHEKAPLPPLGDNDVLVNFHYASLNYRDLIIPKGKYPFPTSLPVIPASDGAGTVLATGPRVTSFHPGDAVLTQFNQTHQAGLITSADQGSSTGGAVNGTLTRHGIFPSTALVHKPNNLSFKEASTLPCAALTAWNALYGLQGRRLMSGDWVLTQGTGGVSIFALQFAKAAGARVIATTSSENKAEVLKKLGADHVLNYKSTAKWGEEAKKITGTNGGVDHVLEVGGPTSMAQSLAAIKPEGFEEMVKAYEGGGISNPVTDEKIWGLEELKEAYGHMWEQRHFGKVVVKVDDCGGSKL